MERIQEENSPFLSSYRRVGSINGGWYNTRRQYRSVAFGTWKVGGARNLSIRRGISESESQSSRSFDTNRNYLVSAAATDRSSFRLYPSAPNSAKSRISLSCNNSVRANNTVTALVSQEDTVLAGAAVMDRHRKERTPGSRSINISEMDRINGNAWIPNVISLNEKKSALPGGIDIPSSFGGVRDEQFSTRHCGSLSRRKTDKLETSIQRVHQRIYDSATLPGRSHSKIPTSSAIALPPPSEILMVPSSTSPSHQQQRPFFEIHYPSELSPPSPDEERNFALQRQYEDHSAVPTSQCSTNLITVTDHESTPSTMKSATTIVDDTLNDSGLSKSVSSNDSQKTSSGAFHSWDEVFDHLKREMAYMRQRDAQIFADLQFVELQLRNVKNRALAASKSDYALMNNNNNNNRNNNNNDHRILERRQIKLGELVESMPL